MASRRRCELTLLWTIYVASTRHAVAQHRMEVKPVPVAKLMRRGQPLQHISEHARLPWKRLPKKNGMTSLVLGPDGSFESLHGSSLSDLAQDAFSRQNTSQAEWWWRRHFRRAKSRFKRKLTRHVDKFKRVAKAMKGKYGDKLKELAKAAKGVLKACGAGAVTGLVMGNPAALATTASCVKDKAIALKADAKNILSDAKAEAVAQGKDIASVAQEASSAASVTVAHIMKFGNQLEQQAKAGNMTVTQAVQAMETQAIKETINGTVAVESKMVAGMAKTGKALKTIAKDAKKAASEVSAGDNKTANVSTKFK